MDITITLSPEEQTAVEWARTQHSNMHRGPGGPGGPGGRGRAETPITPPTVEQYVSQLCCQQLAVTRAQYAKYREEVALQKYYALPADVQTTILDQIDAALQ